MPSLHPAGLVAALLLAVAAPSASAQSPGAIPSPTAPTPASDFSCPMHPEVHQDHPGSCPRCGMTLRPVAVVPPPGSPPPAPAPATAQPVAQPSTAPGTPMHGDSRPAAAPMEAIPALSGASTMDGMGGMGGALGLGMSREASGTAWQPDATPSRGHHLMAGDWMLMLHYVFFGGLDVQTGARGDRRLMSTNWVMGMARHPLLGGSVMGRVMLSAEPITTGGPAGYPLLLQSGETADGVALHDRQHPHDLFMEVAVDYQHPVSDEVAVELYLAPSGEPALGPVAFPHRISAAADPLAALGHHWLDSSHISFGVITGAVFTRELKLELSVFNGREPDENRYNFDLRAPDSLSARLTFNPSARWSFQASAGFLASPEALNPTLSEQRVTASATHVVPFHDGSWSTTVAWGRDLPSSGAASDTYLLETTLERGRNTFFGRGELVAKSGEDLVLDPPLSDGVYPVGALSLGYVRDLGTYGHVIPGLGLMGTLNFLGSELATVYGGRMPLGGMLFVRIRPALLAE